MTEKLSRRMFLACASGLCAAVGTAYTRSPIRLLHASAFDAPFVESSLAPGTLVSVERRGMRFYVAWRGRVLGRLPFAAGMYEWIASRRGSHRPLRLVHVGRSAQGRLLLEVST